MTIDYQEKIPNNVDLNEDRRLQRALERWLPGYQQWWHELGPAESESMDVYLRTAISVESGGWANYGHVRMPDYRWGIFLAHPEADRRVNFGMHKGDPAWQEVPGEYRAELRRLIVTQGDTEPASVEQQRQLGKTCPSLYDLRNLFQVNVEEGRHLWAMVYLLHGFFGRDGREEAEAMLERHSGDPDKPRILNAFNEKTPDWLSFFMFTYFTDRDGKYQLASLAESAFDPLSRTCRFMLTEEAHHMFVGETGIRRVVQRTCEIMNQHKTGEVRKFGVVDLPTVQKYLNFHFSASVDLFGQELSTNAANYYTMGLKGRFQETRIDDDHRLGDARYPVSEVKGDSVVTVEAPALTAVNERLRDDYTVDCQRGVDKWNRVIRDAGIDFELKIPHRAFNRKIGVFAGIRATPEGQIITEAQWDRAHGDWLPNPADQAYVQSLMAPVTEPGKMASWIAAPAKGINGQAIDFEYVRFN
jgi:benzoyl-CoA 2,3-dioxygenase component B